MWYVHIVWYHHRMEYSYNQSGIRSNTPIPSGMVGSLLAMCTYSLPYLCADQRQQRVAVLDRACSGPLRIESAAEHRVLVPVEESKLPRRRKRTTAGSPPCARVWWLVGSACGLMLSLEAARGYARHGSIDRGGYALSSNEVIDASLWYGAQMNPSRRIPPEWTEHVDPGYDVKKICHGKFVWNECRCKDGPGGRIVDHPNIIAAANYRAQLPL